jgi:class 3 adenylate cyclase
VGKTYMACGGLKIVESKIDSRLLGNHFSVRVVDYAFEMLSVANSIKLKTGGKLKVKIGIHTGDVVTGVVGETKPQFSLIGDTVNKTSRVCSKCPSKQILISKETHKQLEIYSNNFTYESFEVFMKGIGTEKVYKVFKKGLKSGLLHS